MIAFRNTEDAYQSADLTFVNAAGKEIVLLALTHVGNNSYFEITSKRVEQYPGLVIWEGRTRRRLHAMPYERIALDLGYAVQRAWWNKLSRKLSRTKRLIRGDLPARQSKALMAAENKGVVTPPDWEQYIERIRSAVSREVPSGRLLWEWLMREHQAFLLSWPLVEESERAAWLSETASVLARDSRAPEDQLRAGLAAYLASYGYEEQGRILGWLDARDEQLKHTIRVHCQDANVIVPWGGGHIERLRGFPEELGYTLQDERWHTIFYASTYSAEEARNALSRIMNRADITTAT